MKFIKTKLLKETSILKSPDKYEYKDVLLNVDQIGYIGPDKTSKGQPYYIIYNPSGTKYAFIDPENAKQIFEVIGVEL